MIEQDFPFCLLKRVRACAHTAPRVQTSVLCSIGLYSVNCRPASAYASTHKHTHTRLLCTLPEAQGTQVSFYLDSSSVSFAVSHWAGQPDAITFLEWYRWRVWTILGVFPQAHEALNTLLTTWWRKICSSLSKSDIWGIFLVQPCQFSSIQNSIGLKVIFPSPFSYSLKSFLSVNDTRFTISCKSRRKLC